MLKPFPHFEWGLMSGLTEPLWHKESRCSSGSGSSLRSAFQCRGEIKCVFSKSVFFTNLYLNMCICQKFMSKGSFRKEKSPDVSLEVAQISNQHINGGKNQMCFFTNFCLNLYFQKCIKK